MSPLFGRRPSSASARNSFRPARRARLAVQTLESRITPYTLSGYSWASPNVSFSFMPDGTPAEGSTSSLFALLNATAPAATWQREVARALQSWAEVSRLNFRLAADPGDIRVGAVPQTGSLAYSYYPTGSSLAGDVYLSPAYQFHVGADYDLYSIMVHEFGHSLGLRHSDVGDPVMAPSYLGVLAGLRPDDVAGVRAIYGARQSDAYDAAAANDTLATATALGLSGGGLGVTADLTGRADADHYRVTAPGDSLTVSVDARNRSLLAPRVLVYDAAGAVVGYATAEYGQVATLSLTGLTAGQTYYLAVDGATDDALGTGAYALTAQFGSPSAPAAPTGLTATAAGSTQVTLAWADNSTNEDGFRIERSTDGSAFTHVADAPAGATSHAVTGLAAGTTYHFRVRAYNADGDSAWSNTAQAATPPAGLTPDRFEMNDTVALARNLGTIASTSQAGLTVHAGTDLDYFVFKPKATAKYTIQTAFAGTNGNLDLAVYNAGQVLVGSSTGTGDGEAVTLSLTRNRQYYVKVFGAGGATNSYDLSVSRNGTGALRGGERGPRDIRDAFMADGSDEHHHHGGADEHHDGSTDEHGGGGSGGPAAALAAPHGRADVVSTEGLTWAEVARAGRQAATTGFVRPDGIPPAKTSWHRLAWARTTAGVNGTDPVGRTGDGGNQDWGPPPVQEDWLAL